MSIKMIEDNKKELPVIISVDEIQSVVSHEVFNKIINTLLLYYSSANKEISEEEIVQKVKELGGKGRKVMTILERREQKGIEKGIELGKKQGIEQGIERGIEQGVAKGILKVVKNAISKGIETNDIMDLTGMTEKEIEEIIKISIKNKHKE